MSGAPFTLGGYATGSYQCRCAGCDDEFTGDKRSLFCLPCAARKAAAEIDRLAADIAAERDAGVHYRTEIGKLKAAMLPLLSTGARKRVADIAETWGAMGQRQLASDLRILLDGDAKRRAALESNP